MGQHNGNHIKERALQRASSESQRAIAAVSKKMVARAKKKLVPRKEWYTPVLLNGKLIGYVCGCGTSVKTFINATMVPHGELT
jgi:hypothetical protein